MTYQLHHIIAETAIFRVGWLDEERTTAVLHALQSWDWQDAHVAVGALSHSQMQVEHPVYTILTYSVGSSGLPRGYGVISNLKRLMEYDVPHERLVIIIGQHSVISNFLTVTSQIYGLGRILGKYRYVPTFAAAIELIERDKRR